MITVDEVKSAIQTLKDYQEQNMYGDSVPDEIGQGFILATDVKLIKRFNPKTHDPDSTVCGINCCSGYLLGVTLEILSDKMNRVVQEIVGKTKDKAARN